MRREPLTREIVAIHREALSAFPDDDLVRGVDRTTGGGTLIKLGRPGAPPSTILKIASTEASRRLLERETTVLTALRADERLAGWRALLPRPIAQGVMRGRGYRPDSALGGVSVTTSTRGDPRLIGAAAEAIAVLHTKTATTVAGGSDLAERWVDAPLRVLRHATRSRGLTHRLERLRDELHGAVTAGTFTVAWIHGDYWLGNLLFSETLSPTGIVDWEAAAPLELPLHDVLHLLLYTRRLTSGRQLSQVLCEELGEQEWSAAERAMLDGHWSWLETDSLSRRHMLLLYWLRHAGVHAGQQGSTVGYRYRVWERRNVLPVLAAL